MTEEDWLCTLYRVGNGYNLYYRVIRWAWAQRATCPFSIQHDDLGPLMQLQPKMSRSLSQEPCRQMRAPTRPTSIREQCPEQKAWETAVFGDQIWEGKYPEMMHHSFELAK